MVLGSSSHYPYTEARGPPGSDDESRIGRENAQESGAEMCRRWGVGKVGGFSCKGASGSVSALSRLMYAGGGEERLIRS